MGEIAFLIFGALYFTYSTFCDRCMTVARLILPKFGEGVAAMHLPESYLRARKAQHRIAFAFGLLTAGSIYFYSWLPWYVGIILLGLIWYYSGSVGRREGFDEYRKALAAMIDHDPGDSPDYTAMLEAEANLSNAELMARI
ncbi:hypothetical protein OT109_06125 [Phycisphaeraceae bacterium D3-23]